jgi:N-dimethylarginine dimethylaminohydrolase
MLFFNLIPVSENDANQLACNAVVVNETVIFPSEKIDAIQTVESLGLNAVVADVSEFLKSGGACQCLVIALN